ncbi:MAG: DNA adenine methylase [Candidatus Desulforudaceae bacterium]
MSKPAPALRYSGSKWILAKWICRHLPPHRTYLEPYFGSGAVFFNKTPSVIETINDLNRDVVNLFRVIRDHKDELIRLVSLTPWARAEYYNSYEKTGDPVEDARRFLVRCWMAYGAKLSDRAGWAHNIQAKVGQKSKSCPRVWQGLPARIEQAAERLRDAQIEEQPALEVIQRYRYPEVLIYADPPYLLSTRSKRQYAVEMTDQEHVELLDALDDHLGPVLLSGYANELYDERLKHWVRREAQAVAQNGRRRVEVLYINPVAAKSLQMSMFGEVIP